MPQKKTTEHTADSVVAALKRIADKKTRDGMLRYGIPNDNAFGVPMSKMQELAKEIGRSHALAEAVWKTGWYEAQTIAAFLAEPERVTPAQMDRWVKDFDNWAICDTVCFKLWDQTPHAFAKVEQWSDARGEFIKRTSFALLASLALHDKKSGDEPFAKCISLMERAADDERNFVKKGVSWALRSVGRRSAALYAECVELSRRLVESENSAARWIGRDALRDLAKPQLVKRLAAKR